jgi:hypothetical protein
LKNILGLFAGILILLLAGCASVPMAPMDQDSKAKEFLPPPNKASLYIYRSEIIGYFIPMSVAVNGKVIGQTLAHTYFRLNLRPGKYTIESHAYENISTLSLPMKAGENYFVWQEVKMGWWTWGRSLLQQVFESNGRALVMESKLIATTISEDDIAPLDVPIVTPSLSQTPSNDSVTQKLRELQNLRKEGIITEDDFQKKKQQLLDKF